MTKPLTDRERCERTIANAHRMVWVAAGYADLADDQGLAEDLYQICTELTRLGESMIAPRSKRLKAEAEAMRRHGL